MTVTRESPPADESTSARTSNKIFEAAYLKGAECIQKGPGSHQALSGKSTFEILKRPIWPPHPRPRISVYNCSKLKALSRNHGRNFSMRVGLGKLVLRALGVFKLQQIVVEINTNFSRIFG
jgi:hypothetical protein